MQNMTLPSGNDNTLMETDQHSLTSRLIALITTITFTMLILEPTAVAAKTIWDETQVPEPNITVPAADHSHQNVLKSLKQQLTQHKGKNTRRQAFKPIDLSPLKNELQTADDYLQAEFEQVAEQLQQKNLPPLILERQQAALNEYMQERNTLFGNIEAIEQSSNATEQQQRIDSALEHLEPYLNPGKHPEFDPNDLPFNIPSGEVRAPQEDYPSTRRAAVIDPKAAPTAAALAQSAEIQITPEIQELAQSLDNHPVKIYNWVYNNIKFVPTYGSIQGSQMALETKQANAFDTASLLIALLRAAGIHARYGYGTIRIPVENVMNWVGGATDPKAAQQLLAQGGIPSTALTQGGEIKWIKLEHIWAEAWLDFYPSRGAKHQNGNGDSWTPLDASYKQYEYTQGMNLSEQVPFDAQALATSLESTAQNETEGWVQNIDNQAIQSSLENYQSQLETYIEQTKPDATVGDVLGTQSIIESKREQLAAGLPYQVIKRGERYIELPDNYRKKFSFSLYRNQTDQTHENAAFTYQENLSQLAGKRITFSFSPSTEADQQLLESFIPQGKNLTPEQLLEQLPTSLPGYLIKLKAELKIDGDIVHSADGFSMGQELYTTTKISRLNSGVWHTAKNKPIAGEFYAIAVDPQNISAKQLQTTKDRLEQTKTALENQQIEQVTKDELIGDMLHAAATSYFAANDNNLALLNKTAPTLAYRQPSFGTISTNLTPVYIFNIPRQVNMSGLFVDMDVVAQSLWAKDNNKDTTRTVAQQVGATTSALEHEIPELFFTNEQNPGEAVSAVKALALASQQGQKIFQIKQSNLEFALSQLSPNISQDIRDEIRSSVLTGKEVTISQDNIQVAGWSGVGYIVADPETGAGAYRIAGGGNGAQATLVLGTVIGILALSTAIIVPVWGPAILAGALGIIWFIMEISRLLDPHTKFSPEVFIYTMNMGMVLVGGVWLLIPKFFSKYIATNMIQNIIYVLTTFLLAI